jgi:hypothetical protein
MVALAASMYDLTGVNANAAALGELLFLAIGAVVTALLFYGLRTQQKRS